MSSIIKNIFGNPDDKKAQSGTKQAHQNCGICQEAFQLGQDDFRLPHCVACVDSGRAKQASYWKQHFAEKRANTLSPDMKVLLAKLQESHLGKEYLEGVSATSRIASNNNIRTFSEIKQDQLQYVASLETIKSQVMEYLPKIVADLGLTDIIEAKFGGLEFVADLLVPAKINKPIATSSNTTAALRSIVAEELGHFGVTDSMLKSEASVQSLSHDMNTKVKKVAAKESDILTGGIRRVESGSAVVRSLVANSGVFAPEPVALEQSLPADEPAIGEEAPLAQEPALGQPEADPEFVGSVVRVPDEAGMEDNAQAVENQGGMPTMNEGIIPHSEQAFYDQTPDVDQILPQAGAIRRIEQSTAPRVRPIPKVAAVAKPSVDMISFAGLATKGNPVKVVNLDAKAKMILENAPIRNSVVASYSDGSTSSWNCYASNKGFIYVNDDSQFLAESPTRFAEFIASEPSFVRWAYLPEELSVEDEQPHNDVSALALPGEAESLGGGPLDTPNTPQELGDPSLNELEPTVLNSSNDNQIGIVNDQDTLLGNELGQPSEDDVLDVATELLPDIQNEHPGLDDEQHMNMALVAAVDILNSLVKQAAGASEPRKLPTEDYTTFINRMNQQHPDVVDAYKNYYYDPKSRGSEVLSLPDWLEQKSAPTMPDFSMGSAPVVNQRVETLNNAAPPVAPQNALQDSVPVTAPTGQVVDTPVDKIRNQTLENAMTRYKDVEPQKAVAASAVSEILEVVAGMNDAEFTEIGVPALVEAGYSDEDIINAYATFTDKEHRQEKHIEESEKEAGKSDEEAEAIGYATVNKEKKEAEMSKKADGCDEVYGDYSAVADVVKNDKEADEEAKRGLHNATTEDVGQKALEGMNAVTANFDNLRQEHKLMEELEGPRAADEFMENLPEQRLPGSCCSLYDQGIDCGHGEMD